jgi:MFS family permease
MKGESLVLKVLALLNIRKEEFSKVILFTLLQVLIGAVIGLLTGGIDAWYLGREPLPVEDTLYRYLASFLPRQRHGSSALAVVPFIQSAGAVILIGLGTLYASLSDRRDKQQLFRRVIILGTGLLLAALGLCLIDQFRFRIPFLAAALYSLRFPAGVFLSLLFWDAAGAFFDRRQGLRVFGTILLGSAIGYSAGSAAAGALSLFVPVYFAFLPASLCALGGVFLLGRIRRRYTPVEAPVYKTGFSAGEIFGGLADFVTTPVLRTILLSTVIFGILSGLIMFTWSNTVTARFGDNAGGTMAFVRSIMTILEALILSRIISQPPLGRKMKYSWLVQWGFLILGIAAFLVSMVGTADFTRQIGSALLSPAAITLFSAVNGRKRGRSITINTMILAPAGMALAPLILIAMMRWGIRDWLLPLLLVLLVLRIILSGQANRQYQKSMAKKASSLSSGFGGGLQEAVDAALSGEAALKGFMDRTLRESPRFREAVWQILSGSAGTAHAYRTLKPFKPADTDPAFMWYLVLALKAEGGAVLDGCREWTKKYPLSRTEPLAAAKITWYLGHDRAEADHRLERLWRHLLRDKRISPADRLAALRLLARFYRPEWSGKLPLLWKNPGWRDQLLEAASGFPHPDFDPWIYKALEDPDLRDKAAVLLTRRPSLDTERLGSLLEQGGDPSLMMVIPDLLSREGKEGGRKILLEHFRRLTDRFFTDRDGLGEETGLPVYPGDGALPVYLFRSIEALLQFPAVLPPDLRKQADRLADAAERSAAGLLSAWSRNRPKTFPLKPLAERLVNEDLESMVRLQFAAALLENFRPGDLPIVRLVLEQLRRDQRGIPPGVLETAVVLLPAKRYKFLTALSDTMTPAERLVRIKGWIKDPGFDFPALRDLWKRSAGGWQSDTRRRLAEAL